ncbi:hypothetical protein EYV94_12665 [Puteibacter caeruleilacunae]|nr:hypothetical protein EYV94_12665 [Puteibacter caeruleilacunae]
MLRVGIIGNSNRLQEQIQLLNDIRLFSIVGFMPADQTTEESIKHDIPIYHDIDGLSAKCDAIIILDSYFANFKNLSALIRKTKPVFLERTRYLSITERQQLYRLAQESGWKVQVSNKMLHRPIVKSTKQLVNFPKIIEFASTYPLRGDDQFKPIPTKIFQEISLIHYLTNSRIKKMNVKATSINIPKSIDAMHLRLDFMSGTISNIMASRIAHESCRTCKIYQPGGFIQANLITNEISTNYSNYTSLEEFTSPFVSEMTEFYNHITSNATITFSLAEEITIWETIDEILHKLKLSF